MTAKQKQNILQYLGYYSGIPDDIWGEQSKAATWKPWEELDAAQMEYDRELVSQYEKALAEIEAALGVTE